LLVAWGYPTHHGDQAEKIMTPQIAAAMSDVISS
jgi:hypothetical protein